MRGDGILLIISMTVSSTPTVYSTVKCFAQLPRGSQVSVSVCDIVCSGLVMTWLTPFNCLNTAPPTALMMYVQLVCLSIFVCLSDAWTNQQQQQQRPFNGLWSGTTRVGRYQKEHSPTHTYPDHRASFIIFLHLQRSMASSLFNLRAWQSSRTTSFQVFFGLPLGLVTDERINEWIFYLSTQIQYSKRVNSRTVSTGQKGSKSTYNCHKR